MTSEASSQSAQPATRSNAAIGTLLIGVALLMLGNGLQISLLGLRAASEGFSTTVIWNALSVLVHRYD